MAPSVSGADAAAAAPEADPKGRAIAYAADDRRKASGLAALALASDRFAAAREFALVVEAMHGKAGQTPRTVAVLDALLAEPRVRRLLAPAHAAASGFAALVPQDVSLRDAAALLNLGEAEGPTAFYWFVGRPSDEMRRDYASRPSRAAELVRRLDIADDEVQALLRQFHVDGPSARPLAAQLLDLCERVAALTAPRPQREAMPFARVVEVLRGEAERGVLDAELVAIAAERLLAGRLPLAEGTTQNG